MGCPVTAIPPSAYLAAKNAVDAKSFCAVTRGALIDQLRTQCKVSSSEALTVCDVGAGSLSMLSFFAAIASEIGCKSLDYIAVESCSDVVDSACHALLAGGFTLTSGSYTIGASNTLAGGDACRLSGALRVDPATMITVQLHVLKMDFLEVTRAMLPPRVDVAVACCFADLLPPSVLATQIIRLCPNASCYLPITFAGETAFEYHSASAESTRPGPRDPLVFRAYHRHLIENEGQSLSVPGLTESFERTGALQLIKPGDSSWLIDKNVDSTMWEAMMSFFANAAPFVWSQGEDFECWFQTRRELRPRIRVKNVDLLFLLPPVVGVCQEQYDAVFFVNPRQLQVQAVRRGPDASASFPPRLQPRAQLADSTVELETCRSMISSGTELKIWRGNFTNDEALDSTIPGMADAKMVYPMQYGYSLVGRVVAAGPNVPLNWLGALVFSFQGHASSVITGLANCMRVPLGIEVADAVFLPAMETALSIVHDAHARPMERVLVIGQGLIGLLVTKLLSLQALAEVVAIDRIESRRKLALRCGATRALERPQGVADYDVCIEVCGNASALQTAIDSTRYGGRVVIASWYGDQLAHLQLGTRFHRSHLTLVVSQVSMLPAELSDRWTKQRRFDACWELIRRVRPSQLLEARVFKLAEVGAAFEMLDEAAISVAEVTYAES
jgi:2-desacetyl-2-hydroxyethyl bacteriochlorophyllide A dehydrogenase